MATTVVYGSNVSMQIRDDRKAVTVLYGDDRTRCIAAVICVIFKRHPEYVNVEERLNVETILGNEMSSKVERYINQYPETDEPSAQQTSDFYQKIVYPFNLTLVKCEMLKHLILNNPFILVLSDEVCQASNMSITMLSYTVTITINEERVQLLANKQLAAIRARVTATQIKIEVVSQLGWSALNETMTKFIYNVPSRPSASQVYYQYDIANRRNPNNDNCCVIL